MNINTYIFLILFSFTSVNAIGEEAVEASSTEPMAREFETQASMNQPIVGLVATAFHWTLWGYDHFQKLHSEGFAAFSIALAKSFSSKDGPHYRLIGRPVYGLLGGGNRPYLSIPASFFVMDLICHQLVSQFIRQYLFYDTDFSKYSFYISYPLSLAWMTLSIPVVYAHMLRARFHT